MISKAIFTTILLLTFCFTGYTNDSIRQINTNEKAIELINMADSIATADSIYINILKQQLKDLQTSEQAKRIQLEKELKKIEEKDSIYLAEIQKEIRELKNKAVGFPIVIHKDTLFHIYTRLSSLSAQERALVISERLNILYREFFLKTDSLTISETGQTAAIFFNDKIILSITELDAAWYQKDKKEIAEEMKSIILKDIRRFKKDRSILKILKEVGLTVLVLVLLISIIKGLNYLFRAKINTFIWKKRGIWFKGIKFRNNEFVNQSRQTAAVLFLLKVIRFGIIILLIYLALPVLFSIFPPTQKFAELLFGYILSPLRKMISAVLNYIPELITIVVIVVITRFILKFLRFVANEIEKEKLTIPGFFPDWAKPSFNIIRVMILAFMFVVVFPYLPGSDSPVFKGVSVFIGIVFSLGSSSIIGNMVSGLVITYMRPFKIGDQIKIGEVIGNVVEKTPFVTRLRTPKKEYITIPNSNVLSTNVINYSNSKLQGGLVVHTTVTIGYDIPWRKVHQILINAAKKTRNLNLEITPYVLQTSLDDFYVSYQLNAHTNLPDKQPLIYSELHENIQDGFNEGGIEILSPHYRSARDGNNMAIPENYYPENYKSPEFKVNLKKE